MARVLFLTYHLPTPDEPGAGRPWGEACLLRDLGHEVTVVTAGTQYMTGEDIRQNKKGFWSEETFEAIRIIRTYAPSGYRRSIRSRILNYSIYSLLAFVRAIDLSFDFILMGADPLFILPVGYFLSRLKRARLILDERDLYPDTALALGVMKPGILTRILNRWHLFICKRANAIIAATPGIKRTLVEKGIPEEKVSLLFNAFPPEEKNSSGSFALAKGENFQVLYAGGFGLANELMTVLKAAMILDAEKLPITFLFVGAGEKKSEYIKFCGENEINNCRFLPAISRDEMPELLKKSNLAILSFKAAPFWRGTLPSKLFDSLTYGLPVIFAGEGDSADLLQESGAGLVVPPENPNEMAKAIKSLFENRDLLSKLSAHGQIYSEKHFSHESQLNRLREILRIESEKEVNRIRNAYATYDSNSKVQAKRNITNEGTQRIISEWDAKIHFLISHSRWSSLTDCKILEIGCGKGEPIAYLRHLGALPKNLYGIDLLPDRIETARTRFPEINWKCSNADKLEFQNQSFDLLLAITLFSSILDLGMARQVAKEIDRVLKPGGAVLWYDFRYNNPTNAEVKGMTRKMILDLFPKYRDQLESVTLIPPIARRLGFLTPFLYPILSRIPIMRSHYIGFLIKPESINPL